MKKEKNWIEKFQSREPYEVKVMKIDIAGMKRGEAVLVPSIKMITDFIRAIPKGRSVRIQEMRKKLAQKYKAQVTCPIYTGYHLRTIVEAMFEMLKNGVAFSRVPPMWRILNEKCPTFRKLSPERANIIRQKWAEERLNMQE